MKYKVFHPDHEITAHFLLDMKNAINSDEFVDLFKQAGFLDKADEEWASLQALLDIFNQLDVQGGAMLNYVSIGMRIMEDAILPPAFSALPFETQLAKAGSTLYPHYNRGTDIGYIKDELLETGHLLYRFKNPYPDDVWYGIVYKLAQRLIPAPLRWKVYYDSELPRRELGGEETIIHLTWDTSKE